MSKLESFILAIDTPQGERYLHIKDYQGGSTVLALVILNVVRLPLNMEDATALRDELTRIIDKVQEE